MWGWGWWSRRFWWQIDVMSWSSSSSVLDHYLKWSLVTTEMSRICYCLIMWARKVSQTSKQTITVLYWTRSIHRHILSRSTIYFFVIQVKLCTWEQILNKSQFCQEFLPKFSLLFVARKNQHLQNCPGPRSSDHGHASFAAAPGWWRIKWHGLLYRYFTLSGQIMIFHQPRFPWKKGIPLTKPSFGVRSCEVAIIWPDPIEIGGI